MKKKAEIYLQVDLSIRNSIMYLFCYVHRYVPDIKLIGKTVWFTGIIKLCLLGHNVCCYITNKFEVKVKSFYGVRKKEIFKFRW